MATISDEIRELAGEAGIYSNACVALRALADRVDREMVELPRDRDGVPIHVGDTVYLNDGRAADVARIFFMPTIAYAMCWDGDRCTERQPSDITHTRPDSLERIAGDIEAVNERQGEDNEWRADAVFVSESKLCEWADRIRKLAAEKGDERCSSCLLTSYLASRCQHRWPHLRCGGRRARGLTS